MYIDICIHVIYVHIHIPWLHALCRQDKQETKQNKARYIKTSSGLSPTRKFKSFLSFFLSESWVATTQINLCTYLVLNTQFINPDPRDCRFIKSDLEIGCGRPRVPFHNSPPSSFQVLWSTSLSGFLLWLSETAGQKGAGRHNIVLSPSPRKKRGKTSWGKKIDGE